VAGAAALVRARFPQLTAAQVKQRLERTAVDLSDKGWDPKFGHGRLDVQKALFAP
jgi:subtilisin family serine protease